MGERGEQVVGIGGSGCGLGMILHAERRDVQQLDALRRSVVKVHMRKANEAKLLIAHHGSHAGTDPEAQIAVCRMLIIATGKLRHYFAQAIPYQAKAVVLRGDLNATAHQVHNGLVATAVTKLELFDLGAASQANHLVAQANAEHRHLAKQLLYLRVSALDRIGVAGAVGKKDAVRVLGEHVLSRGVPRNHGEVAAGTHQALKNAALDAAVVGDHAMAGSRGGSVCERVGRGQVGDAEAVGAVAAYALYKVLANQAGCLV